MTDLNWKLKCSPLPIEWWQSPWVLLTIKLNNKSKVFRIRGYELSHPEGAQKSKSVHRIFIVKVASKWDCQCFRSNQIMIRIGLHAFNAFTSSQCEKPIQSHLVELISKLLKAQKFATRFERSIEIKVVCFFLTISSLFTVSICYDEVSQTHSNT